MSTRDQARAVTKAALADLEATENELAALPRLYSLDPRDHTKRPHIDAWAAYKTQESDILTRRAQAAETAQNALIELLQDADLETADYIKNELLPVVTITDRISYTLPE